MTEVSLIQVKDKNGVWVWALEYRNVIINMYAQFAVTLPTWIVAAKIQELNSNRRVIVRY